MDREAILKQLLCIQACRCDQVVVKWVAKSWEGLEIDGRTEPGRIKLITEAQKLKVYLLEEDLKAACPPLELIDALSQFCGIVDPENIMLLSHILMQTDLKRLGDDLRRRGIPNNFGETIIKGKSPSLPTPARVVGGVGNADNINEELVFAPRTSNSPSRNTIRSNPGAESKKKGHFQSPSQLPTKFQAVRNALISLSATLYTSNNFDEDLRVLGELYVGPLLSLS